MRNRQHLKIARVSVQWLLLISLLFLSQVPTVASWLEDSLLFTIYCLLFGIFGLETAVRDWRETPVFNPNTKGITLLLAVIGMIFGPLVIGSSTAALTVCVGLIAVRLFKNLTNLHKLTRE